MFKKFIKYTAIAVSPFILLVLGAAGVGFYQGIQASQQFASVEAEFENFIAEYEHCGTIDDETVFAESNCHTVCDSFFECRNDYLVMQDMVQHQYQILLNSNDTYTDEEYREEFGSEIELTTEPGPAPKMEN